MHLDRIDLPERRLRLACLRVGDGPRLALVAHGFPDHPASFLPLLRDLAAAGFTAVAPALRGYAPSDPAPDGRYDLEALGADLVALPRALGFARAALVGHDWGALAGYAACNLSPETFTKLAALAVPPIPAFLHNLPRDPAQLRRSWYIGLFQLPGLAERRLAADDLALIDRLWRAWSPGLDPAAQGAALAAVKDTFRRPGTQAAALAYYRALAPRRPTIFRRALALMRRPLRVPALVLAGADDGCIGPAMFQGAALAAQAPLDLRVLAGLGHFMHLEDPPRVHRLLLDHLADA